MEYTPNTAKTHANHKPARDRVRGEIDHHSASDAMATSPLGMTQPMVSVHACGKMECARKAFSKGVGSVHLANPASSSNAAAQRFAALCKYLVMLPPDAGPTR
jgi:hypothetical protein